MSENEFIARAADCLHRAASTQNEAERQTWLALAEGWLLMSRYEEEPGQRSVAKLLTKDEARRVVAMVARLPELAH